MQIEQTIIQIKTIGTLFMKQNHSDVITCKQTFVSLLLITEALKFVGYQHKERLYYFSAFTTKTLKS